MVVMKSWAMTDVGAVRKHNEDNLLDRPEIGLWVVADGAGGHDAGELASTMIVAELAKLPEIVSNCSLQPDISAIIKRVHESLQSEATQRGRGHIIASTFVSLNVFTGKYSCLWAGDSRAYLLRAGELKQLSHDHSLVQELVDTGKLSQQDAENHPHANVITRAVGDDSETLVIDEATGMAVSGDCFLLCSDGLCKTLSETEIRSILSAPRASSPAERLVAAALAHRVNDNVTAIVIDIP